MQNLVLKKRETIRFLENFPKNSRFFFVDCIYMAFVIAENKIYTFSPENKQFVYKTCFQEHLSNSKEEIVCCTFIIEDHLLFILFADGKIITFDLNDGIMKHSIELEDEQKISDAKFSSDQELLAIVTDDNQMYLYNKLLILKRQYNLNLDEYGAKEMINVNWGSKSTQFHGQGMRDHRTVKEEYIPLSVWDDNKSFIEWKSDDNSFLINLVSKKGHRLLKLFNRDGVLQHTSEYVAGLEKNVAWKPSGTLIAASQQLTSTNTHEILFFENNGLKKQGQNLKLPYKANHFLITKLSWSFDSTVLMICGYQIEFQNPDGPDKCFDRICQDVLLFTQNNYVWYLKQRLRFHEDFLENIFWDEFDVMKLHFITANGFYSCHQYELIEQATDQGCVLLVDDSQLNISDLSMTVVPPPLFTYSIKFKDNPIKQVCFQNDLLAVFLADDILIIFKLTDATIEEINKIHYPITYDFVNIYDDFHLVYFPVFYEKVPKISELILPLIDNESKIFGSIGKNIVHFDYKNEKQVVFDQELEFICETMTLLSNDKLIISTSDELYCFDFVTKNLTRTLENMKEFGRINKIFVTNDSDERTHLIVWTNKKSLHYDEIVIINHTPVTTVLLYKNDYLLFTANDEFYCYPLKNFNVAKCKQNYPARKLERGSKIVAVSNFDGKVVVELPRGNLEAFYPRVLLLDFVNELIQNKNYVKAFEILRRNRINLNYICDYEFGSFIENCHEFIAQLNDEQIDWICLFIYELSPNNYFHLLNHQPEVKIENKMNIVCDTFIKHLEQIDKIKFLKPILLSHVKKTKPEIVDALFIIKDLPDSNQQDIAIKYLLIIIDVNQLLDEALGTYDFDILLMVASRSNKDPKEYMAMIENFKKIEDENYRKFQIDLHLHRFGKALLNLSKCPDRINEALELIENKHLFREAIEIFDLNNPGKKYDNAYKQMWTMYGDYLFKKDYYEEAAIAYKRASNYLRAYKMYVQTSNWNSACLCARLAYSDSEEDYRNLLKSLSQNLAMNGHYLEASYINERYLNDYLEAFLILVKGHHWQQARRIHMEFDLDDCHFEQEFKSEMINCLEHILDSINSATTQLSEHLKRLNQLHQNDNLDLDDGEDVYSDTSSICDSASVTSYNTANSANTALRRNKNIANIKRRAKKLEQKKYVLKRGSPNEDIQIIYAIKEIINKSEILFKEGSSLINILFDEYYCEQSRQLQTKLDSLQNQIQESIEFVWNSDNYTKRLENDELLKMAPKLEIMSAWKFVLN